MCGFICRTQSSVFSFINKYLHCHVKVIPLSMVFLGCHSSFIVFQGLNITPPPHFLNQYPIIQVTESVFCSCIHTHTHACRQTHVHTLTHTHISLCLLITLTLMNRDILIHSSLSTSQPLLQSISPSLILTLSLSISLWECSSVSVTLERSYLVK